jgi:hypothetical protein
VESWIVQLLTILAVAVGAVASFVSTRLVDRARWRREEALRWDSKWHLSYLPDSLTAQGGDGKRLFGGIRSGIFRIYPTR